MELVVSVLGIVGSAYATLRALRCVQAGQG